MQYLQYTLKNLFINDFKISFYHFVYDYFTNNCKIISIWFKKWKYFTLLKSWKRIHVILLTVLKYHTALSPVGLILQFVYECDLEVGAHLQKLLPIDLPRHIAEFEDLKYKKKTLSNWTFMISILFEKKNFNRTNFKLKNNIVYYMEASESK